MALPAALVEDVFVQNGDECAARLEGCLPDTFEEDAAATVVEAWQDNDDNGERSASFCRGCPRHDPKLTS